MFMGEYQHAMDGKGRIIMPAKLRDGLGDTFIITRGLENCLFVYPRKEWEQLELKLKALPFTKKDVRAFTRFLLSGAIDVEVDKQGRVLIPNNLREFAGIDRDCVIIGVSSRVEIWSKERWEEYSTAADASFEEIAETIVDFEL
ncbi:cell division/cell wall cluster transcriptional repressor MraZ [Desulfuribacillus stibiiarsenatis]|uniref:Transcriptional regulator MraZ n=1 Tax=Desulfuribacillus stibiiarsenatis TaxID=1390249 RepID=A0A1E5L414_9FIRM|nr:cell division/cell wall cluster transcriptional repressor MraZ [Desulfuribacillus stibiiarsenatis]